MKVNEVGGALVNIGEMTNIYRSLAGKLEGKRLLGRSWHRCKNNNGVRGCELDSSGSA
jgi:hypothetical protein